MCRPPYPNKRGEAGVSLLEVLIAISLLGICFAALFSSLSTDLRTISRLHQHDQAVEWATNQLNELMLDPTLEPGQARRGVSDSGFLWRVETDLVDKQPGPAPDRPVELMRIVLDVSRDSVAEARIIRLETLKLRIPAAVTRP